MNEIYISYSHKDEEWKNRLVKHLRVLEKKSDITVWDDKKNIKPGEQWNRDIQIPFEKALKEAQIIIILISEAFLTSEFFSREVEVPLALHRRENEGVHVIRLLER
jgi:hypothetical protein